MNSIVLLIIYTLLIALVELHFRVTVGQIVVHLIRLLMGRA